MTHILIIEDDSSIRKFMSVNLKARGYTVAEADSARAGLERLAAESPDLVLLDNGLPDQSGIELLKAVGSQPDPSDIPFVLITGTSREFLHDIPDVPYVVHILTKPISLNTLLEIVSTTLRHTTAT